MVVTPSSAENWKPAKPSVSAGVIRRGAIAKPSSDIRLRKREAPSASGSVLPAMMFPAASRWTQLHSFVIGSGGQRFRRRRSFLPARARPSPASAATPTAHRMRGSRRALGKAIAVYGTGWRRRVSRKLYRRVLTCAAHVMHPLGSRVTARLVLRIVLTLTITALAGTSRFAPGTKLSEGTRWTLLAIAVAVGLIWVVGELLKSTLERLVGFRYLHRGRQSRGATIGLAVGLGQIAIGFALFAAGHHSQVGHSRGLETAGVSMILTGGLVAVVSFLLRVVSVFTTVSTMGVVLGVASLVVVFGVTSGFEREFQDKVLALNAHLIVQAYGDADFDEMNDIQRRLAGMPGVVRMATFLFSAGEVMIGRVGANLKGIDLHQGADDLRRALEQGKVEDLEKPARCPLPGTTPPRTTTDVG